MNQHTVNWFKKTAHMTACACPHSLEGTSRRQGEEVVFVGQPGKQTQNVNEFHLMFFQNEFQLSKLFLLDASQSCNLLPKQFLPCCQSSFVRGLIVCDAAGEVAVHCCEALLFVKFLGQLWPKEHKLKGH